MWKKPRKVEEDVVSYLYQINNELDNHKEKAGVMDTEYDSGNPVEFLVDNVIEEMKNRTASVAIHRYGSQILEKILQNSNRVQFGRLFSRLSSYYFYLATNRYGSHIMEMCLAMCATYGARGQIDICDIPVQRLSEPEENVDNAESIVTNHTASLVSLIVSMTEELMISPTDFFFLWRHNSACHVIQSLLCLVCGLPILQFRRGANAKHSDSTLLSQELNVVCMHESLLDPATGGLNLFQSADSACAPYHASSVLQETLVQIMSAILDPTLKHVYESCLSSVEGCLSLSLVLRLLATRVVKEDDELDLIQDKDALWNNLTSSIISSSDGTIFHTLSGEASLFVQALIETCNKTNFSHVISNIVDSRYLSLYATHANGNFVIQSLIRRCLTLPSSSLFCKLTDKISAIQAFDDNDDDGMIHFISNLIDRKYWGVVFRLVEACFDLLDGFSMSVARRERMIDISRKLVSCLLKSSIKSHSKGSVDSDNWGNLSDAIVGNLVPAPECFVNWLLKPTTAFSQQQSHTVVNANGAKILQILIRQRALPALSRQACTGMIQVSNCRHISSPLSIVNLCCDKFTYGLLVKKILIIKEEEDADYKTELINAIISQLCSFLEIEPFPAEVWNSFTYSFQGCDCLRLLFEQADITNKAKLVSLLCDYKDQSEYASRNSVHFKEISKVMMCNVYLYAGEDKWRSRIVRLQKMENDVMNIFNEAQGENEVVEKDVIRNQREEIPQWKKEKRIKDEVKQSKVKRKWQDSEPRAFVKQKRSSFDDEVKFSTRATRHELISYLKGPHVLSQLQIEEQIVKPLLQDLKSIKK